MFTYRLVVCSAVSRAGIKENDWFLQEILHGWNACVMGCVQDACSRRRHNRLCISSFGSSFFEALWYNVLYVLTCKCLEAQL